MYNLLKSGHKDIARLIVFCALLSAAAVFWNLSSGAVESAEKEYGEIVQIRSGGPLVNAARVSDIMEKRDFEKEDAKYTAWSQENGVTVENYSLGSRAGLDCALYYFGDNYGTFDLILDNGCALSEKAAFKVFGTTDGVLGEAVIVNGETFIVEKLLNDNRTPLIYKVRDGAAVNFDALNSAGGGGFSESEMRMNFGVSGDIVIVYKDVVKFFSAFGRLVLWVALIAFAFILARAIAKNRGKMLRAAIICGGLALAAAGCLIFIGSPFFIPDSFIPTRWSEFEFWSNAFSRFSDSVRYYFAMKAYVPDMAFRSYAVKILTYALLSAICVITAALWARKTAN